MNEKDLFIKVPVELLPLRLPRTLLLLYGQILLHAADGKGKCFTAHSEAGRGDPGFASGRSITTSRRLSGSG